MISNRIKVPSFDELLNIIVPTEHGIFKIHIAVPLSPFSEAVTRLYEQVEDILHIMHTHDVQEDIEFNSNGHNPISICFNKYALSFHHHTYGWRQQYDCLFDLCSKYYVYVCNDATMHEYTLSANNEGIFISKIGKYEDGGG